MAKTKEEQIQPIVLESKSLQLQKGLLMLHFKKEVEESGYTTLDMMTFEHEVIQRRHRYSSELQRVLNELKLTAELLAETKSQKQTKHKTHEPEEIINYYSGIFFEHVHQLKDKVFRLVDLMIAEGPFTNAYKEPKEMKVGKFLKNKKSILEKIGIYDMLEKWKEDNDSIGVILRRRTQHHHFLSRLQLNNDFQNVQLSKVAMSPPFVSVLSDYGKQRITELGEQSIKKLKDDVVAKQTKAIQEIECILNDLAEKLIIYYEVPTEVDSLVKIVKEYSDFLASLGIHNEASADKIPIPLKAVIAETVNLVKERLGKNIVSIYLVGSCGRGEFAKGTSDINLYIITKNKGAFKVVQHPLSFILLSEDEFLSEQHKKDRFICWSDGLLLMGKEFKFQDTDFPKPGSLLCLLLNRRAMEELEALKDEVSILENPDVSVLRGYSIRMAKIMMDYDFGVSMSNKPFYAASRKKKIAYTKETFPLERRTLLLEQIYNGGVVKQEDFSILIDGFLENARKSFEKLLAIEKKILEHVS